MKTQIPLLCVLGCLLVNPSAFAAAAGTVNFIDGQNTTVKSTNNPSTGAIDVQVNSSGGLSSVNPSQFSTNGNQISLSNGASVTNLTIPTGAQAGKFARSTASGVLTWSNTFLGQLFDVSLTSPAQLAYLHYDTGLGGWLNSPLTIPLFPSITNLQGYANGGTVAEEIHNGDLLLDAGNVTASGGGSFGAITNSGALLESQLTASRALVTDPNKVVTNSVTTASELANVSGTTSPIQTQLNTKIDSTPQYPLLISGTKISEPAGAHHTNGVFDVSGSASPNLTIEAGSVQAVDLFRVIDFSSNVKLWLSSNYVFGTTSHTNSGGMTNGGPFVPLQLAASDVAVTDPNKVLTNPPPGSVGMALFKTLTGPQWSNVVASGGAALSVTNSRVVGGPLLLTSTNFTVDANGTNFVRYIATANLALMPPSNGFDAETVIYAITQGGTGNNTAILTNNVSGANTATWGTGQEVTGVTLSTNLGRTDYITMIYWQASNRWDIVGLGTKYPGP